MADLIVRQACAADQAAITALVRAERLNPNGLDWQNFLVAVQGGEIVGAGQIRRHPDGSREVGSLVVAPRYRGRGVAKRLLDALLVDPPADLFLVTSQALAGYYERWGFRSTGVLATPRCVRRNFILGQMAGILSLMKRRRPRRLVILKQAA